MKRINFLLLAIFFTFCACGNDEPLNEESADIPSTTSSAETTSETSTTELKVNKKTTTTSLETSTKIKTETTAHEESINESTTEITEEIADIPENRVISDGSETEQDDYFTDPVPEGMPEPVEPENVEIDEQKKHMCTFSIECAEIFNNIDDFDEDKIDILPTDGVLLSATEIEFSEGESVFDVLQRVCRENKIHMEFSFTPLYNSAYIEGIGNIYEFDCGSTSGWQYCVNGWYPNYGSSRYQLADGEVIEWHYICKLDDEFYSGDE